MATFPDQVNVDESQIKRLTSIYLSAYQEIADRFGDSSGFSSFKRRVILAQIESILVDFGEEVETIIEEVIPDAYEAGAGQAIVQLKSINAPIDIRTGFNRIHKEAIAALVDDTAKAFGESIQGVNRSARRLMGQATKDAITQQLATGQISGDALEKIKKNVIRILQTDGLPALVDKGNHPWSLDRYSEMLIRTKAVEARNTGLKNRLVENNYDLVQVSQHGATDVCAKWEGKILSITGATPGYKTLQDATEDGLFHPNCKHAINGLDMGLARKTMGWNTKTQEYEVGRLE